MHNITYHIKNDNEFEVICIKFEKIEIYNLRITFDKYYIATKCTI